MTANEQPSTSQANGRLVAPSEADRTAVLKQWCGAASGMVGERGDVPIEPDDAVAYRLLEAAEAAMSRGQTRQGVNILRLVVKDYRQSREAAFARRVIDRLVDQDGEHGR